MNCDSLGGNYYQDHEQQTACHACPPHTRFVGILGASNNSSCQCTEGAVSLIASCLVTADRACFNCRLLQQRRTGEGPQLFATVEFGKRSKIVLRCCRLAKNVRAELPPLSSSFAGCAHSCRPRDMVCVRRPGRFSMPGALEPSFSRCG
jgi:hypothetical protein